MAQDVPLRVRGVTRSSGGMLSSIRAFISFVAAVVRRVDNADIGRIAASLAFTTLLGLVPLFTVAFAYVARFPLFQSWLDALEPVYKQAAQRGLDASLGERGGAAKEG